MRQNLILYSLEQKQTLSKTLESIYVTKRKEDDDDQLDLKDKYIFAPWGFYLKSERNGGSWKKSMESFIEWIKW